MKKYFSLLFVSLFVLMFSVNNNALANTKVFVDVTNSSHSESVNYLSDKGVYNYKDSNYFNGNKAVSRAEVSKILYNLYSKDLKKTRNYNNNFKDINNKSLFSKEIIWSYEVGIFDGSNGKFESNSNLTRAQMSKILVNTFKLSSKGTYSLKDVSKNHWAFNYVSILYGNGITVGDGKGKYLPNNNVTLYQLSTFIYRTIQLTSNTTITNLSDFGNASNSFTTLSSEYDFNWNVIKVGKSLELEGVKNNKVVARYKTEFGKFSSLLPDIKIGVSTKNEVVKALGNPLNSIIKDNSEYLIGSSVGKEYGMYLLNDYYVYVFYDLHNNSKVRSILAINKDSEMKKEGFYGNVSKLSSSRVSSENLMILLMNQARESNDLSKLSNNNSDWSAIGRTHSKDMALNNYFSHNGLNGSNPFDRMISGGMDKNDINWWGENLAYGQFNAIFSHEALMNSKGHRDNILHESFTHSFVGLEYNSKNVPYYTIGFYSLH